MRPNSLKEFKSSFITKHGTSYNDNQDYKQLNRFYQAIINEDITIGLTN
ncbi:MAG: hypothetical protein Q4G04_00180 [bacterium]|nr:hypothetical protein [bacterium]